jgi:hypothetical protein
MVLIGNHLQQHLSMPQRIPHHLSSEDPEDFNMMYPEPPQGVFSSNPIEMNVSPDAFYPRQPAAGSHEFPTTANFDGRAMYTEADQYGMHKGYQHPHPQYPQHHPHGLMSPSLYPEDIDGAGRLPSSNLSTASCGSASSSNAGSPRSAHGQLQPVEWAAPHGLGVSPGIVGQHDYFPANGNEYSYAGTGAGIEEYAAFEYAQHPKPGFVGELSQVPRSSHHQIHQPAQNLLGSPSPSPTSVSSALSSAVTVAALLSSPPLLPPMSSRRDSTVSAVFEPRLAIDTAASPTASPASSRKSSIAFISPTTSASSLSSPPPPVWSSPPACAGSSGVEDLSPAGRLQAPRLVPHFFSQSSGHFVAPLGSSYPSLIHPGMDRAPMGMPTFESSYPPPASAYPASPALTGSPQIRNGSTSPFPNNFHPFSPYAAPVEARRQSIHSFHSVYSAELPFSGDESTKEKQRCPHPDCGKTFKDLKAHMLTHQNERPEKCPIPTCDYHTKGFARKYDKNRHTLTHYKGTMVCGFCPGSGSAAEKSFNRADVFKRHLTAVHGVEQTPPNSRKKMAAGANSGNKKLTGYAPDATGKCSTCSATFSNAQDFYEHLDDGVLRIVPQEDPAEAINAKRLAEVEEDKDVHETLGKNNLPTTTMTSATEEDEDDDMMDDDGDDVEDSIKAAGSLSSPTSASKKAANGVQKSRGMTHSRNGVPLVSGKARGRKSRRDYPSSWGFDKGQMTMKKRVMTVFDGARRLAKDDMMLSTEHEVRVRLSDGKSYVTDLDIQTMKRAEGFHGATEAEKGPWISDDPDEDQLRQMAAAAGH